MPKSKIIISQLNKFTHIFFLILLLSSLYIISPSKSYAVANPQVYYGVYVPGLPSNLTMLSTFENDAQKKVAIAMWYQQWGSSFSANFQPSWMNIVRSHGSIPMITWEPWDPSNPNGVTQPTYSLQHIIQGNFDTYLTQWAQAAKTWGHPFFLRFAHEMNGNWYPWSEQTNGNMSGEYVLAWKHIYTIFKTNGVTNVTWVWSPNVGYPSSIPLQELYPGDTYVDWVSMDGYNFGTGVLNKSWQTFSQIFSTTYTALQNITAKPMMITEVSSSELGGNKASWITDAYTTQLPTNFPAIKAIIWFNESKEADWRIESSTSSINAFMKAVASPYFAANSFTQLNISPISVPNSPITSPPTITPTVNPSSTIFSLTTCPHGLGKCGDNVNASSSGTVTPQHQQRSVTVTILDAMSQPVTSLQGTVRYNTTAQNFQGNVLGSVQPGQYLMQIKIDGYLSTLVEGIITVASSQPIVIPAVSLVTGDIDNNGQIDILDYNILIGCFGSKQNTSSCTASPTTQTAGADLNDDGLVDGSDYNLFLRELSVQHGR